MNLRKIVIGISATIVVALSSCSDSNSSASYTPTQSIVDSLTVAYPSATNVSWSYQEGYAKADFDSTSVWFNTQGEIKKVCQEIPYDSLPQAVKDTLTARAYTSTNGWTFDEIEKITSVDLGSLYNVKLTNDSSKVEIKLSADGVVLKIKTLDALAKEPFKRGRHHHGGKGNDEHKNAPVELPQTLIDYISTQYPGAVISDSHYMKGLYKVEFLYNSQEYELTIDQSLNVIKTEIAIQYDSLPAEVKTAFEASEYQSWTKDEIEQETQNSVTTYSIKVHQSRLRLELTYSSTGELISKK